MREACMGDVDGRWGHCSRQLGAEMEVYAWRHQRKYVFLIEFLQFIYEKFVLLSIMRGTSISNE